MEENKFDKIIEVALFNMFTLSKENKIIRLTNFSFTKKEDLAIFSIAKMAQVIFGFELELNVNPFTYFFYNLKYKYSKICKRTSNKSGINVEDFIAHIEVANSAQGIFRKIYELYYERH